MCHGRKTALKSKNRDIIFYLSNRERFCSEDGKFQGRIDKNEMRKTLRKGSEVEDTKKNRWER